MIVARRCDSAAAVAMRRTKNNLPLTLSKHSSAVQKMYIRRNEVTDFEFFFSIFFIRDGVLFLLCGPVFFVYIYLLSSVDCVHWCFVCDASAKSASTRKRK